MVNASVNELVPIKTATTMLRMFAPLSLPFVMDIFLNVDFVLQNLHRFGSHWPTESTRRDSLDRSDVVEN